MLKVGDKIPNINVTTHKGETLNLGDLKGKKIVLFFYPRANTPGCTAQSCNLNDNYSRLTAQGYEVIGVSPDTCLLYTSPSPRDRYISRMPSSA